MIDPTFQELALAELDAVYRLARHLTRSAQQAEDFVQETYLRAFRYSGSFTLGERGIRPWLFRILHNVIYTLESQHQREQTVLDGLREMKRGDGAAVEAVMVDCSTLDWENVDERLKAAVAELPIPYRVVFLLSALEGLKYREIADVAEVPVGTVMSRLSRARSMLAAKLVDLGAERGMRSTGESFSRESGSPQRTEAAPREHVSE